MSYYTEQDVLLLGPVIETIMGEYYQQNSADTTDLLGGYQELVVDVLKDNKNDPVPTLIEIFYRYVFNDIIRESVEDLLFVQELSQMPLFIFLEEGVQYLNIHKAIVARWRLKIGK